MTFSKEKLRSEYKEIRNQISNKEEKSKEIVNKLIVEEVFKKAKNIAIYSSINSEVDTTKLLQISLALSKKVYYPKVIKDGIMTFLQVNSIKDLQIGKYNILEPITNIEASKLDLIIVPGICFDLQFNRLGYGKGYYDRYLKSKNVIKVGICFECQILKGSFIPFKENDIKMDYIISEEDVYVKKLKIKVKR